MNKIEEFIQNNRPECIIINTVDSDELFALPNPYSIPAKGGIFECMYYWDTYFDNLGMLKSGYAHQAKNNVDNMLYLVNKFGFMPNGSKPTFLSRSQPPFLSEMVKDVYDYYKDDKWLDYAYETLRKEYDFWMTERITPTGLNQYGCKINPEKIDWHANGYVKRVGYRPDKTNEEIAVHSISICESGWDMNPRCGDEAYNYIQIDLNSLLYMLEKNMQSFAQILGKDESSLWAQKAENRKKLVNEFMTDENGLFFDYDFVKNRLGTIYSAASLFPLFVNMASESQAKAALDALWRIEEEYGIATCEKTDSPYTYQWDYPNAWPCMQYVTVKSLMNYGFLEDAMRIRDKYINATEKIFDATGNLWEKYNATDGTINVTNEYEMPPMMGWTAGVYITLNKM